MDKGGIVETKRPQLITAIIDGYSVATILRLLKFGENPEEQFDGYNAYQWAEITRYSAAIHVLSGFRVGSLKNKKEES